MAKVSEKDNSESARSKLLDCSDLLHFLGDRGDKVVVTWEGGGGQFKCCGVSRRDVGLVHLLDGKTGEVVASVLHGKLPDFLGDVECRLPDDARLEGHVPL